MHDPDAVILGDVDRPVHVGVAEKREHRVDALLHEKLAEGLVDREFHDGAVLVLILMRLWTGSAGGLHQLGRFGAP